MRIKIIPIATTSSEKINERRIARVKASAGYLQLLTDRENPQYSVRMSDYNYNNH